MKSKTFKKNYKFFNQVTYFIKNIVFLITLDKKILLNIHKIVNKAEDLFEKSKSKLVSLNTNLHCSYVYYFLWFIEYTYIYIYIYTSVFPKVKCFVSCALLLKITWTEKPVLVLFSRNGTNLNKCRGQRIIYKTL